MDLNKKIAELEGVYKDFELEAREYTTGAVCRPGCAFCCTDVGNVDAVTLEAYIIQDRISNMAPAARKAIRRKIAKNKADKEKRRKSPCPFLKKDKTCSIYDIRPFSCRRLYSVEKCSPKGASIHRGAVAFADAAVKRLQALDDTGYSGHLTFLLHLLGDVKFRSLYESGGFDPSKIVEFGKSHGIGINRMLAGKSKIPGLDNLSGKGI